MFAIVSGVIHKGYKHFASLNIAKAKKCHILSHPVRHTLKSTLFSNKCLRLFTFHFRSEKISWRMSFVEMRGQMPPNLAGNK